VETWRDKILEQFVPQISRLSIVSDPDNLLTEEKTTVLLRKSGFDILEFADSIEFRFAYESQYRSIWDKGLKTELVVIIHTHKTDLNFLPYDLLQSGKKFYFSILDIFPMFSPAILNLLDRPYLDLLYSFRDRFPKEKQGDRFTIDFLLKYIYKLDIDTVNDELDLVKALLHIHYGNLDIPDPFMERLEYLFNERKIACPPSIKLLLTNKERFTAYLLEKHREMLNNSPEVRFFCNIDNDEEKINTLQKYIKNINTAGELNHNDWINIAWKHAHLASLVYSGGHKSQIEEYELLHSKTNESFEEWLSLYYPGLRTIPPLAPVMVHHIPHFLAYQYRQNKKPIALIVIDGLALDQWITLRDSLGLGTVQYIEKALFAWIPTLTSVSRQSIFSGKNPYEYADSIHTTEREEKLWSLFWENNDFIRQNVLYMKGIDSDEKITELSDRIISNKTLTMGLVLNKIDNIIHGMEMGMEGLHNQIKLYGKNGTLGKLIIDLLEKDFEIWISSDHGNIECIGHGRPSEASIAKSRGERVRVYKSRELLKSMMEKFPWSAYWRPIGLPDEYFPLISKGNNAFLPENTRAVSHGSISMQETVVPFIKVVRR